MANDFLDLEEAYVDELSKTTETGAPVSQTPQALAPLAPTPQATSPPVDYSDLEQPPPALLPEVQPVQPQVQAPAPEAQDYSDLINEVGIDDALGRRNLGEAFLGGVGRGVQDIRAAVPRLQGVAQEALGADAGVVAGFEEKARAIQADADEAVIPSVWDVRNGEDFSYWVTEKMGEQAPNLLSMFVGGFAGRSLGAIAGRGLAAKPATVEKLATYGQWGGVGAANVGLEAGGTAEEQYAATGQYNPKVVAGAALLKGALESYTPFKFMQELKFAGKVTPGELLRATGRIAGREFVTESAQEATDVTARLYSDPSYRYFGNGMVARIAESGLTGAVVGGGYGGPITAGTRGVTLGGEGQEEQVVDEGISEGPLGFLRRQMSPGKAMEDVSDTLDRAVEAVDDVVEMSLVEPQIGPDAKRARVAQEEVDRWLDFNDDQVNRYLIITEGNEHANKIYTSTGVEEVRATRMGQAEPVRLAQVDMKSLQLGAISADISDLAEATEKDVWFLPSVLETDKPFLLHGFNVLKGKYAGSLLAPMYLAGASGNLVAKEQKELDGIYEELLTEGLRIVPRRGARKFNYNGTLEGKEVEETVDSERSRAVFMADVTTSAPAQAGKVGTYYGSPATQVTGWIPIAIDFNKLKNWVDYLVPVPAGTWLGYGDIDLLGRALVFPKEMTFEDQRRFLVNAVERAAKGNYKYEVKTRANGVLSWAQQGVYFKYEMADELGGNYMVVKELPPTALMPGVNRVGIEGQTALGFNQRKRHGFSEVTLVRGGSFLASDIVAAKRMFEWGQKLQPVIKHFNDRFGFPRPVSLVIHEGNSRYGAYYAQDDSTIHVAPRDPALGEMSYASDAGQFYVVVMHELGHAITIGSYHRLPAHVQRKVKAAYQRALFNHRVTGKHSRSHAILLGINPGKISSDYYLTFSEWLAEQFRRFATSDTQVLTEVDKFFKSVGRDMDEFFDRVVKGYPTYSGKDMLEPDYGFVPWMRYLEKVADGGGSAIDLKLAAIQAQGLKNVPLEMKPTAEAIELLLYRMKKKGILPKDVKTKVIGGGGLTVEGLEEAGSFDPVNRVLKIYVGAVASTMDLTVAARTVIHEAFHSIQDMLTDQERTLLVKAAMDAGVISNENLGIYFRHYKKAGVRAKLEGEALDRFVQRKMENELMAHLIESRINGKQYDSVVAQMLDAIIELWNKIVSLVMSGRVRTAETVINAFYRGELTSRYDNRGVDKKGTIALRSAMAVTRAEDIAIGSEHPGPVLAYHSTRHDFDKFAPQKSADIGIHFGTTDQANARIEVSGGTKIFPVILDIHNPLDINDGDHYLSGSIFALESRGIEITPDERTAFTLAYTSQPGAYKEGRKIRQEVIWKAVERAGYDSIRYPNTVEGKGYSYIVWKKGQVISATSKEELMALVVGRSTANFKADAVVQLEPNLWMAKAVLEGSKKKPTFVKYGYYENAPPAFEQEFNNAPVEEKVEWLGKEIGYVNMVWEGDVKGWDIAMFNTYKEFRRKGFAKKFLASVEKDLGTTIKASSIFLPEGYMFWKARAPEQVQYHVWDGNNETWLSPNFVKDGLRRWKMALQRVTEGKGSRADLDDIKAEIKRYEGLYDKVPKGAWTDPMLDTAHSIVRIEHRVRETERALDEVGSDLEMAVTGETQGNVLSDYERGMAKESTPEPEMANMHTVLSLIRKGEKDPKVRRDLSVLMDEGDKISKFAKMFFSLNQIAFLNPHIEQLQNYLTKTRLWNAARMKWVSRADGLARRWDGLPEVRQREVLNDLVFWATEMRYRTAAERTAKVLRLPTVIELQTEMARLGMTQETAQIYYDIQNLFSEFLVDFQRVSEQNIRNRFVGNPQGMAAAIASLRADVRAMQSRPYFPFVRFGRYMVVVRDRTQGNKVVHFATYPTERERDAAVRPTKARHLGMELSIGAIPEDMQEFMGLPASMISEIKATLPGLTPVQKNWLELFEHEYAPESSFAKRFLERKGTPGYSLDGIRAFAHYFRNGSAYLARLEYHDQLRDEITRLEARKPQASTKRALMLEMLNEHFDYIMSGGRDWGKLKSFITVFHLGGSVAAAAMNLTQFPMYTSHYMASQFGAKAYKTLANVGKGVRNAITGLPANASLGKQAARLELITQGVLDTGQAAELGSFAEGNNLARLVGGTRAQKYWRDFSYYSMILFSTAEKVNRDWTFESAYELAMAHPNAKHLQDLAQLRLLEIVDITGKVYDIGGQPYSLSGQEAIALIYAREIIEHTQFNYNASSRPKFLRGPVASTLQIFFSYTQQVLFAMRHYPGAKRMVFMYMAMFGMMGLPGADDLDWLIRALARKFGLDFSPKMVAKEAINALAKGTIFEDVAADLFLHGISRYGFGTGFLPEGYGVPQFDASINGSMGKLVPGMADGLRAASNGGTWQEISGAVARDAAGAGFGQVFTMLQFLAAEPGTSAWKKWEMTFPRSVKQASRAVRFGVEGETTKGGAVIKSFDPKDPDDMATLAAQAMGWTPRKLSEYWDWYRDVKDQEAFIQTRRLALYTQSDVARRSKDPEARAAVRDAIRAFNKEMRDSGLPGMMIKSQGLDQSFKARARARNLQERGLPAQKGLRPLYKEGQPDVIHEQRVR